MILMSKILMFLKLKIFEINLLKIFGKKNFCIKNVCLPVSQALNFRVCCVCFTRLLVSTEIDASGQRTRLIGRKFRTPITSFKKASLFLNFVKFCVFEISIHQ